jgi:lysine-N-methylase
MIRPAYSEQFRCIGSACEDNCCHHWDVDVDADTYAKLHSLPHGQVRSLVDEHVVRKEPAATAAAGGPFAIIQRLPSGNCPFLSAERLCRIHAEHGESYLSSTCTTFPREKHEIDGQKETVLALSCPEAARLTLLNPDLLDGESYTSFNWDDRAPGVADLRAYFWIIREFSIHLIRNPSYPLWQRMFLLGIFSRRLDAIARGELKRDFPDFFRDFTAAIPDGAMRAALDKVQADAGLQLELLLGLVNQRITPDGGLCLNTAKVLRLDATLTSTRAEGEPAHRPEMLYAFAQGIGQSPEVSRELQVANYTLAWERYAAPFFRKHPYFLENYLINQIFRNAFPLGAHLFGNAQPLDFAGAYSRLAIQFALVKGMLIGVAGFYKDEFSTAQAVHTVQAGFRYFEHDPKFLERTHAFLAAKNLDNAQGLTTLLRN